MVIIRLVTRINAPVARCFDLARSVDFHLASAPGTGEAVVGGVRSGLMGMGDDVTWRARHLGFRFELTSRITAWRPPHAFRDSQVRGPFREFDHDHFFDPWEARPGWTLATDCFQFRAPLGPLGVVAEQLVLARHMRRFLERRAKLLKAALEGDGWRRYLEGTAAAAG